MSTIDSRQAAAALFRPVDSPNVAWRHPAEDDSCSDPSATPDGHVVASDGKRLLYLNPDGTRAWDKPVDKWTPFRPAARPEGGAVWAPGGSGLQAYDGDGRETWTFGIGTQMQSIQPGVDRNGDVYVCVRTAEKREPVLVRLDADGEEVWRSKLPMHASCPPLPDGQGGVVVRGDDDRVIHFDERGKEMWNRELPERLNGHPGIAPDGSVWIGNDEGQLFRISPEGQPDEIFRARSQIRGTPAFAGDRAYVTSMDRNLYALDLEGNEIWHHEVGDMMEDGPVVLNDGTVVVAGFEGTIRAVTPDGEEAWSEHVARGPSAMVADGNGSALIGARDHVVALRPGAALENMARHAPVGEAPTIRQEEGWIVIGNVRVPKRD